MTENVIVSKMFGINTEDLKYLTLIPLTISTLVIFYVLFARKRYRKPKIPEDVLEERIRSFEPRPLIDPETLKDGEEIERYQPVQSMKGSLNLVKVNYYGFLDSIDIRKEAEACIRKYGVGSCGPRGFYGTIDIHLDLEERLAKFMNMEEAVLYSYGFSTIASAIGAYCKRSDIIFCDEKISFCAKQGILAAKGKEIYFKHNDVKDLESKMSTITQLEDQNLNARPSRKFLIVEGIYGATGQICALPEIIKLCKEYKVRVFVDETYSFGVLGRTGRGITEYFNVDRSDVDMIMGSLECTLASIGGFCVGASVVIEHQRLSGLGYCFSASLPPFLCQASICALDKLEEQPELYSKLREVAVFVDVALHEIKGLSILSSPESPLKVVTLEEDIPFDDKFEKVDKIQSYCACEGLYIYQTGVDLQFHVNINLSDLDIIKIKNTITGAVMFVES